MEMSQFKVTSSTIEVQQGKLIVQLHCEVVRTYSCKVVSRCKHFAKHKTRSETCTLNKVINHKIKTYLLLTINFQHF